MKRSKAYVNNRRDQIVAILEKDGKASVADLAERFGVSPLTIRRDLDFLEERKVLSREYGTAKLLNPMGRPSGSRQIRAITAISRLAARYVDDGDLILINTSATAIAMLDHIEAQDVTCMTNMGKAILLDSIRPNISLMLTGGEIPAMALADCLCRMVPGVLPEESCYTDESHWNGLLEYPQYSRPEEWHGRKVPAILLSGNHGSVDDWRRKESYKRTMARRPDLWARFDESAVKTKHDKKILQQAKDEFAAQQENEE